MPAEIEPPELASLLDFAERSRAGDWSLRSALVRYAQPDPGRVRQVLENVRRIDGAARAHGKLFEKQGHAVWAAVTADAEPGGDVDPQVVGLLRTAADLDRLGDELAAWAVAPDGGNPAEEVDRVVAAVAARLDELGVAREDPEDRPRPGPRGAPRRRGAT